MAFSLATSAPRCARPQRLRAALPPRASAAGAPSTGAAVPVGTRVRVKDAITIFHAPKLKAGLSLQGMEGVVEKHADVAPDGSLLSCTQVRAAAAAAAAHWRVGALALSVCVALPVQQPLLVRFELPAGADGKKAPSFLSHLTPAEVDVVAAASAAVAASAGAAGPAAGAAASGSAAAAGGAYATCLAEGTVFEARRPTQPSAGARRRSAASAQRLAARRP